AVLNLSDPVQIPTDVTVAVRYDDYDPPVDPLHESQALATYVGLGLDSVVDRVAKRDGITHTLARLKVERNIKERLELEAIGLKLQGQGGADPAPMAAP
ncbi:MAG: hypothetical protein FJ100_24000, partial [Deltaproteobacteria bacterium]|nr:hypothetical protein [Deltaproteobacteria bacterium]